MLAGRKILTPAEQILFDLGVTDPADIDLEAVAWTEGAIVKYRRLRGCEARIVGRDDRAVISINDASPLARQRFSIGHELGHWRHHRGKALFCRSSDVGLKSTYNQNNVELVANKFAADLLMPGYLFDQVARSYAKPDFSTVDAVADQFNVSRSAAAIRLVQRGHFPAILVCHGPHGRKWFFHSPVVPGRWFPRPDLDPESSAFAVQFGRSVGTAYLSRIGADAWFDRYDADRFEVREQSVRYMRDSSLTLVVFDDEKMLRE
jgi:Zn-dependent peptidase ImmA (M78 family)